MPLLYHVGPLKVSVVHCGFFPTAPPLLLGVFIPLSFQLCPHGSVPPFFFLMGLTPLPVALISRYLLGVHLATVAVFRLQVLRRRRKRCWLCGVREISVGFVMFGFPGEPLSLFLAQVYEAPIVITCRPAHAGMFHVLFCFFLSLIQLFLTSPRVSWASRRKWAESAPRVSPHVLRSKWDGSWFLDLLPVGVCLGNVRGIF